MKVLFQISKITFAIFLLLFLTMEFTSCFSSKKKTANLTTDLINCWTDSREENTTPNEEVFRPCDAMEFPPSRFRASFTLLENGECTYMLFPAPNDAHQAYEGTWIYEDEGTVLTIKDADGAVVKSYEIVLLESGKLVLKEI